MRKKDKLKIIEKRAKIIQLEINVLAAKIELLKLTKPNQLK